MYFGATDGALRHLLPNSRIAQFYTAAPRITLRSTNRPQNPLENPLIFKENLYCFINALFNFDHKKYFPFSDDNQANLCLRAWSQAQIAQIAPRRIWQHQIKVHRTKRALRSCAARSIFGWETSIYDRELPFLKNKNHTPFFELVSDAICRNSRCRCICNTASQWIRK